MWSNISGLGAGTWMAQLPLTERPRQPAHGGAVLASVDDTAERPPSPLDLSLRRSAPVTGSRAGSVEPPRLPSPAQPAQPDELIVLGSSDEAESPGPAERGGRAARERSTTPSAALMGAGTSPPLRVSARQGFPLRHPNDSSQVHPRFATAFGELACGVQVRQALLPPEVAIALGRRMGLSKAEVARMSSLLQADVLSEMQALVSGSGTRPRYTVRRLRADELQPHEQGLVGHPSLFALPEADPLRQHTARNGRVLGLCLSTSKPQALFRQNPTGRFERVLDAEEPSVLCGLPVPGGRIHDERRSVVLPHTALLPGQPLRVDDQRINTQLVPFQMELVDATRCVCLHTVHALVGLDELYGPQHPTREVRIAFGDTHLREIERVNSAQGLDPVNPGSQLVGPGVWLEPVAMPISAAPTPTATPPSEAPRLQTSRAVARHPTPDRATGHPPIGASAAALPATVTEAVSVQASPDHAKRRSGMPRAFFPAAMSDWLPVDLQAAELQGWPARPRAPVEVLHELVRPWIREQPIFPYSALMPVLAELWARGWSLDRAGLHHYMRSSELSEDCVPMLLSLTALRLPQVLLWLIHQRPRRLGETNSMYMQRLQFCAQLTPLQFRRLQRAGGSVRLPLYMRRVPLRVPRHEPLRDRAARLGRDPDGAGPSGAVRTTAGSSTDRQGESDRVPWRMATQAEIERLDAHRWMPRGFLRALLFSVNAHCAGLDVVPPKVRELAGGEPDDLVRMTWMMHHSPPLVEFLVNHPRRSTESSLHYAQRLLVEAAGDDQLLELLHLLFPSSLCLRSRQKRQTAPAADAAPPEHRTTTTTTTTSVAAPDATAPGAPSRDRSPLRAAASSPQAMVASDTPATAPPVWRPWARSQADEPPAVVRVDLSGDGSRSPIGRP